MTKQQPAQPKIRRLAMERECYMFRQSVLGIVNVLEHWCVSLQTDEWSPDRLQKVHLGLMCDRFKAFMTDERKVTAFQRYFADALTILSAVEEMLPCLTRLHTVRDKILQPYWAPGTRVLRRYERLPASEWTLEDRGALNGGLTQTQQAAFEAQLTRLGHIKLSKVERDELRVAIEAELEP